MKRYAKQTFLLTLALLFLTTLAWTGTAAAETDSNVTNNTAQSYCTYNVSEVNIGRTPAQFSSPGRLLNKTQYNRFNYIASGDWIVTQFPKSNSSNCSYADPVGSNIAYATPATPAANTTHTIVPEINDSIENVEKVSIEYEVPPSLNHGINQSNISLLGIDNNKDGFIEKPLHNSIEYISVPSSDTVQIFLNRNVTIPSDSFLVVRYNGISNPEYADTNMVYTSIVGNRTATDSGIIEYSKNLAGLVGHGAELSIHRGDSQLVTLQSSKTLINNDSVYVFLPTQATANNKGMYSLSIRNKQRANTSTPDYSRSTMMNYTVFRRFAYVFSNPKIRNGTIAVRGYTNVAPGSRVSVQVYNRGRLREKGVTVNKSQSLSINITLPNELLRSELLLINILDYDGKRLGRGVFTKSRLPLEAPDRRP